jgi:CRP/FNR family transcriptional regulator, cyclic AMP receptor protein
VLTVVEKVILLQGVDIFAHASTQQLALVAAIAQERDCEAAVRLFQEATPSDAMYIVVRGRVRVHQGEREVLVAGANEAVGSWALFDEESRLTSATTLEPSLLLRIDRDDFLSVLADHVEITQAILSSVARRLRAVAGKLGGNG